MYRRGIAIAVAAATLALPASAGAAFPGADGKIGFQRNVMSAPELFTMNPDGSDQLSFTGPTGDSPSYSGDGRKVAYRSSLSIVVANTDGTGTPVTVASAFPPFETVSQPALSADGALVAWVDQNTTPGGGYVLLALKRVDGTGPFQSISGASGPAFTSSGSLLYVRDPDPGDMVVDTDIFLKAPDFGEAEDLVSGPELDGAPDMAPDGSAVVFHRLLAGDYDIYRKPLPSGAATDIVATSANELDPVYSPSGTKVAFTKDTSAPVDNGFSDEVFSVDAAGMTTPVNLTNNGPGDGDAAPNWSVVPTPLPAVPASSGAASAAGTVTPGTAKKKCKRKAKKAAATKKKCRKKK
jgi:TolB protein